MNARDAMATLGDLAEWQLGYVTAAQAIDAGVSRVQLHRLAQAGAIERAHSGVYRLAGAPPHRFEHILAPWLAVDPTATYEQRFARPWEGAVATGVTAATLHEVGTFVLDRIEFALPRRRQSRDPGLHFRRAQLTPDEVVDAQGVPATTIERTVADLIAAPRDWSIVADLVEEAHHLGQFDIATAAAALDRIPKAARRGLTGQEVVDDLLADMRAAA